MFHPADGNPFCLLLVGEPVPYVALFEQLFSRPGLRTEMPTGFSLELSATLDEGIARLLQLGVDTLVVDCAYLDPSKVQARLMEAEVTRYVPVLLLDQAERPPAPDAEGRLPESYLGRMEVMIGAAIERRRYLSEHQRRNLDLELSEARLRRVIESNPDGVLIVDAQGVVRLVNRALEQLLGMKRTELLGRMFGVPQVLGEVTLVQVSTAREEKVIELRTVELLWEGQQAHLAFLRDVSSRHRAEQAMSTISRRNNMLVAAISSLNLGVVIADPRQPGLPVIFANHGFAEIAGYTITEVIGAPFNLMDGRDTDPKALAALSEALVQGRSWRGELQNYRRDGSPFWNALTVNPVFDSEGNYISAVGVMRDVTEQVHSARQLRESEANLSALIESTSDVIFSIDRQVRVLTCNATFRKLATSLVGVELGRGTYLLDYLEPGDRDAWHQYVQKSLAGESFVLEQKLTVGVRELYYEVSFSPIRTHDGQITGATLFGRDITQRKVAEAQLLHNAFHDELTGLANRALFSERLERAFSRSKRRDTVFGVLSVGIDRFKNINESLGHAAGDQLLRELARRLEDCVRPSDTVARLSGDEYMILLEEIKDVTDALRVTERIHRSLQQPFVLMQQEIIVTVSIGIVIDTNAYTKTENLLRDASTALFKAKSKPGIRQEIFNRHWHDDAVSRLELENDLRKAIRRNEFVLYYQPIVHMEEGRLAGFEALIRWNHPTKGLVSPGVFIPVAESTGLIVQIGEFVLKEACRQIRQWQLRYPAHQLLTISVNLSPRQSLQGEVIDHIASALRESQLPSGSLKVEVTESLFVENTNQMRVVLEDMAALGVQVQLDDFGTGYSCLSYLHEFPVHALKIDQSFVRRMGPGGTNSAIVQTIRSLAQHLNLSVVAEGVELKHQAAWLRTLGCEYCQGYYFARPMPAAQVEALLALETLPWQPITHIHDEG